MMAEGLLSALVRATLSTAAGACLAQLLLSALRVTSPRAHRVVWTLVAIQGWLLVPWTLHIETDASPVHEPPLVVDQFFDEPPIVVDRRSPADYYAAPSPSAVNESSAPANDVIRRAAISLWMLGTAAIAWLGVRRYLRLIRTIPIGAPTDGEWLAEWREELAAFPRRPAAELRVTDQLGPLLCYIPFGYLVLAPRALWSAIGSSERRVILRHELAHLRRGDLWTALAIRALALPQWFNPLVWLAVRRFDEAGEWACDDLAAGRSTARSLDLANALVQVVELSSGVRSPAALGAHGSPLARRIRRLASPLRVKESTMKQLLAPALLLAIAAVQLIRIEYVAAEEESPLASPPVAVPGTAEEQLRDYTLEPTDEIQLAVVFAEETPPGAAIRLWDEDLKPGPQRIQPDGRLDLAKCGSVFLAGLTIADAEQAITQQMEKTVPGIRVHVTLKAPNSKFATIAIRGYPTPDAADDVVRVQLKYPLSPQQNVGRALVDTPPPRARKLADALVYLLREAADGAKTRKAIEVDPATDRPTPATDWALEPGDRVVIDFRKESPPGPDEITDYHLSDDVQYYAPQRVAQAPVEVATTAELTPAPAVAASESLDAYVIESPDVVEIEVASADFVRTKGAKGKRTYTEIVASDRVADLGKLGRLQVAGRTVAELRKPVQEQRLKEQGDDAQVVVTIKQFNSKVAYIVLRGFGPRPDADFVIRTALPYPLTDVTNVGALLQSAVYPNPVDWKQARVTVRRAVKEGELEREVTIDAAGTPTPETNFPILPGDRMFVDVRPKPAPVAPAIPYPTSELTTGKVRSSSWNEPAPVSPDSTEPGADQATYRFLLVEDTSGSMAEFRELHDKGVMTGDGETLRAALAILEKNKLVATIDAPTLVTSVNGEGMFAFGSQLCRVRSKLAEGSVDIELFAQVVRDDRKYAASATKKLSDGDALVVRLSETKTPADGGEDKTASLYLVMTAKLGALTPTPAAAWGISQGDIPTMRRAIVPAAAEVAPGAPANSIFTPPSQVSR